jgi:predicted nucleic acid-binding protein
MRTVFADTFFFFAVGNDRDPAHTKATAFSLTYTGKLVTTGWVLTELADGWSRPVSWRVEFEPLLSELRANPNVTILTFSDELFKAGIELYADRPDKEWSLTDCISFVVMEREGIREALTGDHHFEQAGFIALLK